MGNESPSPSSSASTSAFASGRSRKRSRPNSSGPSAGPRNSRNAPRPRNSPFSDFRSYMAEKNRKLRNQFDADASTSSLGAGSSGGGGLGIFHGVSIFVDGSTDPSSQELRGYMLKHGGRFENYFSRHTVTHIICTHLPDSKMRNFRAFSRGLPVVKPAWVLDSVAANKLLSWVPYQLHGLVNEIRKQQKLDEFFRHKNISSLKEAETPVNHIVKVDAECSELPLKGQISNSGRQGSEEFACLEHENASRGRSAESTFTDLEDEHSVAEAFDSNPHRPSHKARVSCTEVRDFNKSLHTKCVRSSNQPHSNLTDPNFVENYFKKSRLHFIGTWRSRYHKRFTSLVNEVERSSSIGKSGSDLRKATIIHIDMDCFFVSVVIRNYPELLEKPVAVCHSDNPKGTAEISSANYPARDYGVRAGMFVRDAKARCPHLLIFPYNFEAYEEVADQFYSILHKHCNKVQALSCDEAFLDVTDCGNADPEQIALMIRKEIAETTGCTASAGIAMNLLLARLATRSAKPNGQCSIPLDKVDDYLYDLPIKALPGIGHALGDKLESMELQTCGQLRMISKEALQKDFGKKTGDMLWNYCHGLDNRTVEVVKETKSVGAEVNWGVRFNDDSDCQYFLMNLCKEVTLRLHGCGVQGRTITLKVKKRKKGAGEPTKFMGCGDCESISRSITIPIATDNLVSLQRIAKQIFASLHIDVREVRGVGLQISKLEIVGINKPGHEGNTLDSWFTSSSEKIKKHCKEITCSHKQSESGDLTSGGAGSHEGRTSEFPPLCHLDFEVVKNLPSEIISEMNAVYKGELCDFMGKHGEILGKVKADSHTASMAEDSATNLLPGKPIIHCDADVYVTGERTDLVERGLGAGDNGKEHQYHPPVSTFDLSAETKPLSPRVLDLSKNKKSLSELHLECVFPDNIETTEMAHCKSRSAYASCSGHSDLHIKPAMCVNQIDLMPSSLIQADVSILQQFPEDVKTDINGLLPAHRALKYCKSASSCFVSECSKGVAIQDPEYSETCFWFGSPPKWVEKFSNSDSMILNIIGDIYTKFRENGHLSSTLQSMVPFLHFFSQSSSGEWNVALSSFCELLSQYIGLKIDSDLEELYDCFCLLKRFSSVSKLFLQIYNIALPKLQASVSENYGGNFQLPITKA